MRNTSLTPYPGVVVTNTIWGPIYIINNSSEVDLSQALDCPGQPFIDTRPLRERAQFYLSLGGVPAVGSLLRQHPDMMFALFRCEIAVFGPQSTLAQCIAKAWQVELGESALEGLLADLRHCPELRDMVIELESAHHLCAMGEILLAREISERIAFLECPQPLLLMDRLLLARRVGQMPEMPSSMTGPTLLHHEWLQCLKSSLSPLRLYDSNVLLMPSISMLARNGGQGCTKPFITSLRCFKTENLLELALSARAADLPALALSILAWEHDGVDDCHCNELLSLEVDLLTQLGRLHEAWNLSQHIDHYGARAIRRGRILYAANRSEQAIACVNCGIAAYETGPLAADEHLASLYVMSAQQCLQKDHMLHAQGNLEAFAKVAHHADSSLRAMADLLTAYAAPSPIQKYQSLYGLGERLRSTGEWRFLSVFAQDFMWAGVLPSNGRQAPGSHDLPPVTASQRCRGQVH
ncbi:MAG: hypothetical protein EA401_02355 [Planctomycetota bacterium]|nr:MAG: hypothetical protein EA401_02355 [Planctomycetota bacterium]